MTSTVADIDRVGTLIQGLLDSDLTTLERHDFLDQIEAVGRLEKVAGALGSKYAGEVARRSDPAERGGGFARREGHGNAGNMISRFTGGSVGRSNRQMEAGDAFTLVPVTGAAGAHPGAGERAGDQAGTTDGARQAMPPARREKYPLVAASQVRGELSVEMAAVIVQGLNLLRDRVDPVYLATVEEKFVGKARGLSVHRMKKVVAIAIAKVDHEALVERERRHHDDRYFWWKEEVTGMVTFHGQMDVVTAAPVIEVLSQLTTRDVRKQGRQEDPTADTRTVGQMRADALFELSRHALGCGGMHRSGIRTTVVVRVDQKVRERATGTGRIDGIDTSVSFESLQLLMGDAGIIAQIVDGEGAVLEQGDDERGFTRAQRLALLERDGGCARCGAPPAHCEAHHIRWWEHGGLTNIDNGVMLCTRCHHDVHRYGWQIDVLDGRVYFTPPGGDVSDRFLGGNAALALDLDPPPRPGGDVIRDDELIAMWNTGDPYRGADPCPTAEEIVETDILLHV